MNSKTPRQVLDETITFLSNFPLHDHRVRIKVDKLKKDTEGKRSKWFQKLIDGKMALDPDRIYVAKGGGTSPNLYTLTGLSPLALIHSEYLEEVE